MKLSRLFGLLPGIALCLVVAFMGLLAEAAARNMIGGPGLDALVLAIPIGMAVRAMRGLDARLLPGIDFSAKTLLEIAVALLGLSIGFGQLAEAGLRLAGVIVGVVLVSIAARYAICRLLGIGRNMATLVACGNAICGNSAIVAVAPAIRASREDIASAITFSALLSVVVVLCLPLSLTLLALDQREYGILAGLTIYAVPQVFAATSPVGLHAVQIGIIVKLVRVMMLGPVVMAMTALAARRSTALAAESDEWMRQAAAYCESRDPLLDLSQSVPHGDKRVVIPAAKAPATGPGPRGATRPGRTWSRRPPRTGPAP
jgi:uncharacterized integral membrane protein (TIGR00698 family)